MTDINYTIRTKCIFCKMSLVGTERFESDKTIPVAVFTDHQDTLHQTIPYNVCICETCKTAQTKYLGDLGEIYRVNHADGTGSTMQGLHERVLDIITDNLNDIEGIIEIGSSKGILADKVLATNTFPYHIIDPGYFGKRDDHRTIIEKFYENVDDTQLQANTLIISHVFEHFYNPQDILDKIGSNTNIKHFILVWPDLDYYCNNGVLHLLNTEHTYYVDLEFLIKLIGAQGFQLSYKDMYKGHSVIMCFGRVSTPISTELRQTQVSNTSNVNTFFTYIDERVRLFNDTIEAHPNLPVYLWPCSIHTVFLLTFGFNKRRLSGFLDNSPKKIGGTMYGTGKMCYSFKSKVDDAEECIILLNGGVFNSEVKTSITSEIKHVVC